MKNKKVILNDEIAKKLMKNAYYMAYKILKNESDAEDISSEVMLTVIEKAEQLKDEKAFEVWVNRIVVNKCYDYIKKRKPVLCGDYGTEFIDSSNLEEYNVEFLPEEFVINEEKRRHLMEIIKEETNEVEMTTIMHFYYNEESISYIAKNMECAEVTVKKRLASARKKIKDGIEKRLGKGAVLMAVGITVLGKAMRVEASEITLPETLVKVNGGLKMSKLAGTKTGLSGGVIAGICGGAVAGIAAIVAGVVIATGGGKSDKTDYVTTNPTTMEGVQETTETLTEITTTTEDTEEFVPVEFERYDVEGIDFVAPTVRKEGDTQCKFFWEYKENDFINWFQDNVETTDKYQYNVSNSWEDESMNGRERIFTITTVNGEDNAKIDITTTVYNKDVPSVIGFEYCGKEFEDTITAVKNFIEYMGLKGYEEAILHANNNIRVKTENGVGQFVIMSSYEVNFMHQYEMSVIIYYEDTDFKFDDNYNDIKPTNFEDFDANHKLPEYLQITEFDTSSLSAFHADVYNCIKENINDSIIFDRMKRNIYTYTYNSENGEKIFTGVNGGFVCDSVIFNRGGKDKKGEYTYHVYSEMNEQGAEGFVFSIGVLPVFDDLKYEGNETDADIKLICEARYKVLKKIIPSIGISEEDFCKLYTEGTTYEENIEEDNVYCTIRMDFDNIVIKIYPAQ